MTTKTMRVMDAAWCAAAFAAAGETPPPASHGRLSPFNIYMDKYSALLCEHLFLLKLSQPRILPAQLQRVR
jgi:hypothetical protein